MNQRTRIKLKISLSEAIEKWRESLEDNESRQIPYLGDNTYEIMATAALAVLEGIDDTQTYLIDNDLLREEETP